MFYVRFLIILFVSICLCNGELLAQKKDKPYFSGVTETTPTKVLDIIIPSSQEDFVEIEFEASESVSDGTKGMKREDGKRAFPYSVDKIRVKGIIKCKSNITHATLDHYDSRWKKLHTTTIDYKKFDEVQALQEGTNYYVLSAKNSQGYGSIDTLKEVREKIQYGNYYALLIGVDDYTNWEPLSQPIKEVTALQQILLERYTFKAVEVVENPKNETAIVNAIEEFAKKHSLGENDNLLLLFSGHGQYNEDEDEGYWIPSEGVYHTEGTGGWFSNSRLKKLIQGKFLKDCQHILVVGDACFSASFVSKGSDPLHDLQYSKKSRKAMSSGAYELVPAKSVFMAYFQTFLKDNTKNIITAQDIFNHLQKPVFRSTRKIPQYGAIPIEAHKGGEFFFIPKK